MRLEQAFYELMTLKRIDIASLIKKILKKRSSGKKKNYIVIKK